MPRSIGRIEISGFKRPPQRDESGEKKQKDYRVEISGSLPTELTVIITRSNR